MPVLFAILKSTPSKCKLRMSMRDHVEIKAGTVNANFIYSPWMKDQFCQNAVFRTLNLDEKGKVFHFGIDFKL
jgi:hypothetical protein